MSEKNTQYDDVVSFRIPGIEVTSIPTDSPKIIKVIGVGGGGGNAVNHMYRQGIHDVTFLLCNTDNQALRESPVPVKLQLGQEGLGAGNDPEKACAAAEESAEDIRQLLSDGTRMAFITAGMGGGTGTGAAPVIAKIAKDMGILTVGIVTIPFRWEGEAKINQALDGVEAISKYVDALLVVNNEKMSKEYGNLSVEAARAKADDTLSVAVKSIAEIITVRGVINLDFNDVKNVLQDGGVAIMSTGYGEGDTRVTQAIKDAQYSPLLNNNDVFNSKKILFNISYSKECQLKMNEMDEIRSFMDQFSRGYKLKWGIAVDDTLGQKVKMTLLATGFGIKDIDVEEMTKRVELQSEEEQKKQLEAEEKSKKEQARFKKYYGEEFHSPQRQVYIFTKEDLDNAELISMVEDTPTAKRDKSTYNRITRKSQQDIEDAKVRAQEAQPVPQSGDIINFAEQ